MKKKKETTLDKSFRVFKVNINCEQVGKVPRNITKTLMQMLRNSSYSCPYITQRQDNGTERRVKGQRRVWRWVACCTVEKLHITVYLIGDNAPAMVDRIEEYATKHGLGSTTFVENEIADFTGYFKEKTIQHYGVTAQDLNQNSMSRVYFFDFLKQRKGVHVVRSLT